MERISYSVSVLCRVMQVSSSVYYAWRKQLAEPVKAELVHLCEQVKQVFFEHRRRYGSRRIAAELKKRGVKIGRFLVRRLMREQTLAAISAKRLRTSDSRHNRLASPNLLKEAGNEARSWGEVIIGDITYLPLVGGKWCYLAIFQDKLTRRIVGWELMEEMTAELVVKGLQKAIRAGLVKRNAIIHTDRGWQYVSAEYRNLLARSSLRQSMSGKGNGYDNAQAESFFSRFKVELVEDGIFEDAVTARWEASSYIEGCYNRVRIHSSLGDKTPLEYEKELKNKQERRTRESFVSCLT